MPIILVAVLLVASAGCGGSGLYPVKGKLVYADDQQPVVELKGFGITFDSTEQKISAYGEIKEDGSFELYTTKPGDGVRPGKYKVIVQQPRREPERPNQGDPVVDLSYESVEKTPLEYTVEAKSNDFTIPLKRIAKRRS